MIALALPKLKLKANLTAKEGRKLVFTAKTSILCSFRSAKLVNTWFISLAVCNCMHKYIKK